MPNDYSQSQQFFLDNKQGRDEQMAPAARLSDAMPGCPQLDDQDGTHSGLTNGGSAIRTTQRLGPLKYMDLTFYVYYIHRQLIHNLLELSKHKARGQHYLDALSP